jgi:NADH-quinone oxidoreductase subunit G
MIEAVKRGDAAYDFVEVMACPGGCAGGGGQPIAAQSELADVRGEILWQLDKKSAVRYSHENPDVQALYTEFLEKPLSEKAHHLLHTDHSAWDIAKK